MIENIERAKNIYELRRAGKTFKSIAEFYGLSLERARQIYLRQERRIKHSEYLKRYPTYDLINELERKRDLVRITAKSRLNGADRCGNTNYQSLQELELKYTNLIDVLKE